MRSDPTANPPPKRLALRHLVKRDHAVTDLPLPLGGGRWGWWRQAMTRVRLTDLAHEVLPPADLVLTVDRQGQPQGIAYGREWLARIAASDRTVRARVATVVLDG